MNKYTFDNLPESIKSMFPNAKVFEMIHGEPIRIFSIYGPIGKTYTIIQCTKQPVIDLPRPESMEEFDRYYLPAITQLLHMTLTR